MPLAHRIIPTILCRGRTLVKGKQFDSWRSVGVAAQAVRIHAMRGVDEICLLDIGATPEGRGPDLALIEELSDVLFCPLSVGGGVRSLQDVKNLLRAGADKVVIGTAVLDSMFSKEDDGDFLRDLRDAVGCQAIVCALDVKGKRIYSRCGMKGHNYPAEAAAITMQLLGAGEILLTSIEREGTLQGYDLGLILEVSKAVSIPVIANGGCGSYADMLQAIECGASGVAAGAFFQFTDATPKAAAHYLAERGVEART